MFFRLQVLKKKRRKEEKKVKEIVKKIKAGHFKFTTRACAIVKRKTGIKYPLIVAKVFAGVVNMIVNHHDKVFIDVVVVATQLGESKLIIQNQATTSDNSINWNKNIILKNLQ